MVNASFIKTFARYHLQVAVIFLNDRKFPYCLLKAPFERWPTAKLISSQALLAPAVTDVPPVKGLLHQTVGAERCVAL